MLAILIFLVLIVFSIYCIKKSLGPIDIQYKPYFLSGFINHNNITTLERGLCTLKFKADKFYIVQNDKTVEDNSADIYNMRIWTFKGGLYLAITTKTHNEYKFSLVEPEKNNDMMTACIYKIFSAIAKKLKIELVDCGESGDD